MSILGSVLGDLGGKVVEALSSRSQRKHEQKVQALELKNPLFKANRTDPAVRSSIMRGSLSKSRTPGSRTRSFCSSCQFP